MRFTAAGIMLGAVLLAVPGPVLARAATWRRTSATAAPDATSAKPLVTSSVSPSWPARPYRVVGLGDSVPAAAACGCTSYVTLVGRSEAARRGLAADVANHAVSGLRTAGLLDQLKDPAVRGDLADADLVMVTIGANDFDSDEVTDDSCAPPDLSCYQDDLRQQASQLSKVLDEVDAIQQTAGTVLVTGYWNVFLDGRVAAALGDDYVVNSAALTDAANAQIAQIAEAHGDTYVDIATPFAAVDDVTTLLADDGDHPNGAGHHTIATALEAALATAP